MSPFRSALRNIRRRLRYTVEDIRYRSRVASLWTAVEASPHRRENVTDRAVEFAVSLFSEDRPGFRFTATNTGTDLYSTTYGVLILGIAGRLYELSSEARERIGDYIVESQNDDGLFRDWSLSSPIAETGHGWGWQHLLPHVLVALNYLGRQPSKEFKYLTDQFQDQSPLSWADRVFSGDGLSASNIFMNTVVPMQYARDFMSADSFGPVVRDLLDHVVEERIPQLLASTNFRSRVSTSNTVKTIYHLLPSILYDRPLATSVCNDLVELALATRHPVAGFGSTCASDACEDMDSVYVLASVSGSHHDEQRMRVLKDALSMLIVNQNSDGGFVFKRFVPFTYGRCDTLTSSADQSNLFGTWFRLLAYAFADSAVSRQTDYWRFSPVPGYQYLSNGPRE